MKKITVKAPAKINLSLDILGRRADGYHFLRTVMQAIDLCDTIHLSMTGDDIKIYAPEKMSPVMKEILPTKLLPLSLIKHKPYRPVFVFRLTK